MLKTPTLQSKPLQVTSKLNGRAYAAAGQAGGAFHSVAVLKAYQANLLIDLDVSKGLSPEVVTDLAIRGSKQTAAIGRAMAAMVFIERHLWINLADIGEKEKHFLLDAPVSPS